MDDKTDYKLGRQFLRVISLLTIVFYTIYGGYQKWTNGNVNLDATDFLLISSAVAILVAVEAVRAYVKRKLGNKN